MVFVVLELFDYVLDSDEGMYDEVDGCDDEE